MSYDERLELLSLVKETLVDDRKFYLGRKDWARVADINRRLKLHAEQVAQCHRTFAIQRKAARSA